MMKNCFPAITAFLCLSLLSLCYANPVNAVNIKVVAETQTTAVSEGDFETPKLDYGTFKYAPSNAPWTFQGGAGISANNSGFTNGNPTAPSGKQVLFIQRGAKANRTTYLTNNGTYRIKLKAAQRGNMNNGGQTFQVLIDGVLIDEITPQSINYEDYFTVALYLSKGNRTIEIKGVNPLGGDNTAFIDQLEWQQIPEWSKSSTWENGTRPQAGDVAIVPMGKIVAINTNAQAKRVQVMGTITAGINMNFSLQTEVLMAMDGGYIEIGRKTVPYWADATITLKGNDPTAEFSESMGTKFIGIMPGAKMEMHGEERLAWTQLNATANKNATSIQLREPVDWKVGEEIVIASSDYNPHQAEQRTITSVSANGRSISFSEPLQFMHWGTIQTYKNDKRTFKLDERAEVALLSRNLKVQGDDFSEENGFGGHIMSMGDSETRMSGVELYRMGQKSELGRYPFHWHWCGDASGQYIENCSIHKSYNRVVTVHHTDNARVENVVGYDHLGHGFFLEDGSETGTLFKNNLGMLTRTPAEGEEVQPHDRVIEGVYTKLPATFWMSNPANDFVGNVCAGSEGSGFWMVMLEEELHDEEQGPKPAILPMGKFLDNRSHSTSFSNFAIDGGIEKGTEELIVGHYRPQLNGRYLSTTIERFTAYKCSDRSIWMRANTMNFKDCRLADNSRATFFAYNQILHNSLIVGQSANRGNPVTQHELTAQRSLPIPTYKEDHFYNRLRGHSIYDGPSGIIDVHFAGFEGSDMAIQTNGAAQKSPIHFARGTSFDAAIPEANKVDFSPANYLGYMYSSGLIDQDGSITGMPGSRITPYINPPDRAPYLASIYEEDFNIEEGALFKEEWDAYICPDERYGLMVVTNGWARETGTPVYTLRSDGPAVYNRQTYNWYSQDPVILNNEIEYTYQYHEICNRISPSLRFVNQNESKVVSFTNMPSKTQVINNASKASSLDNLRASNQQQYFIKDNTVYLKLIGQETSNGRIAQFGNEVPYVSRNVNICQNNNCSNQGGRTNHAMLADFEMGLDGRTVMTRKGNMPFTQPVSDVTNASTAPFDNVDNKVAYTVTSDGDGENDYVDFNLRFPRQVWAEYYSLGLKYDGPPIQVFIRDKTSGYQHLGIYNANDCDHISLGRHIESHLKDEIIELKLRVKESFFTGLNQAKVSRTINLYEVRLNYYEPEAYSTSTFSGMFVDNDGDGKVFVWEKNNNRNDNDVTDFAFDFNTPGDTEAWYPYDNGQIEAINLTGNEFLLRAGGVDPYIIRDNLNIDGDQLDYIQMRVKCQLTGTFQVFWATEDEPGFSASRKVSASYDQLNEWKILKFNVGDHPEWQGKNITRLRIDPVGAAGKHTWIDWVNHHEPTLYALNRMGDTGLEVQYLDGPSKFKNTTEPAETAYGQLGAVWQFDLADWNNDGHIDIVGIKQDNTGTNKTEVHVLDGANNNESFLLHQATILNEVSNDDQFKMADYNGDGIVDLWYIKNTASASGKTELHILNGANNFSSYLLQKASILSVVASDVAEFEVGDYNGDNQPDLWFIKKKNTPNSKTEVHVLDGANEFQTWLLHKASVLHTTNANWSFDLTDYNEDGKQDLLIVNRLGANGKTDLHIMDGDGFQSYLLHQNTNLPTTNENFSFLIGDINELSSGANKTEGLVVEKTKEALLEADFSIYPNPTKGNIQVDLSAYQQAKVSTQVYSVSGQLLLEKTFDTTDSSMGQLALGHLANGMYFIQIEVDGEIQGQQPVVIVK